MSLLEQFGKPYAFMEKTRTPDGEGGFNTEWAEGARLTVFERHDTTIEAQQAENKALASTYTFLLDKNISLTQNDVIKRLEDGQTFRITQPSNEDVTPEMSSLNLTAVKAERWVLE